MSRIRRVNFFGGPGCGKSTKAAELFVQLRRLKYSVELVHEVVKEDAYRKRPITGTYQMRRFGEQIDIEGYLLEAGVELIVTDSPLLLQAYYTKSRNETFWSALKMQVDWVEDKYPALNLFLDRTGIPYEPAGRFQTHEEALEVDRQMEEFLHSQGVPFAKVPTLSESAVLGHVLTATSG